MTEITEGVWFAYQLTVSCGGRNHKDPSIEKYTIVKIDGDDVTVQREVDGAGAETFETKTTFGSCIFDMSDLEKKGSENMTTPFGHIYVNIFESSREGRSERVFLGKDNIVFRDVRTQLQSGGALYTETRELCWTSMKL